MTAFSTKKTFSLFQLYDRFIKDSKSGKRLQPNGKKVSDGTIANYGFTLKLLEKFSADKDFELRIKNTRRLTQREMQTEKNYWIKFYKKFTDYLYQDCGHFDNYVGANIKNVRTFFGYLNKDLLFSTGDFHKLFYVRKEEVPIVTLLPEELNYLIYNKAFQLKLSPLLQRVRDFFVFGCSVALRFSDLVALKKTNIRVIGNNWYLIVRAKKTSADTNICLPEYAIDILLKYQKQKGGFLLPRFNKVNLNKHIKTMAFAAGFTQDVRKTRTQKGAVKNIDKINSKAGFRFCDLVTTHTMRRTAITTMLCLGVPEHIVRKISGHSPMSKEFFRYVSVAQSYHDTETSLFFDKLKNKQLETVPDVISG